MPRSCTSAMGCLSPLQRVRLSSAALLRRSGGGARVIGVHRGFGQYRRLLVDMVRQDCAVRYRDQCRIHVGHGLLWEPATRVVVASADVFLATVVTTESAPGHRVARVMNELRERKAGVVVDSDCQNR